MQVFSSCPSSKNFSFALSILKPVYLSSEVSKIFLSVWTNLCGLKLHLCAPLSCSCRNTPQLALPGAGILLVPFSPRCAHTGCGGTGAAAGARWCQLPEHPRLCSARPLQAFLLAPWEPVVCSSSSGREYEEFNQSQSMPLITLAYL